MKLRSHELRHTLYTHLPLLLAFFLPFVLACVLFAIVGLYPFGDSMILAHDGWHQYYPFLLDFREKLLTGGSLQYTWSFGMGTAYASLYAYYLASPLFLLCVFVPVKWMPEFFAMVTILKIAFAGLFFALYLRIVHRKRGDFAVPFFALMYAFCAFSAGYYWNIMWLDGFAMLPLLIAGLVKLLRDGKFRMYTIALALTIWSNYYVAFFCCIFVALCFFGYCICCPNGFKGFLRRLGRVALCTVIGVGIAAVVLLPTLMGMQSTNSAKASDFDILALYLKGDKVTAPAAPTDAPFWKTLTQETLPGIFSATRRTLANLLTGTQPNSFSGVLPNVFCGFSAVILGLYYCFCKKIKLREKLVKLLLLGFLILSFTFRILTYIWHGFHFPNMLPHRFSFLFSFILVGMAYQAYCHMDSFKRGWLAVILPLSCLLLANAYGLDMGKTTWILSALVLAGMALFFLLWSSKRHGRRMLALVLLCCIVTCEMTYCMGTSIREIGTTKRSSYPWKRDAVEKLLAVAEEDEDDLFWRCETTDPSALNEGALYGYRGVTTFTSSANVNFNRFSGSLGFASWPGSNRYSYSESTPFTNLFAGIRYLLDRKGEYRNTDYNTLVATEDDTTLLRNEAYAGLGFMTRSELADFVADDDVYNAIWEQEDMFRMATGVTDPLYEHLESSTQTAPESCTLFPSGTSGTQYSFSCSEVTEDEKCDFRINYIMPRDGLACLTTVRPVSTCRDLDIYLNGEKLMDRSITVRTMFSLGNLKQGDEISVSYQIESGKSGAISLDVAVLNNEVFDRGAATLTDEVWKLTEATDTHLKGTIEVKEDGLFYTSVPYDAGWRAYVDGEEVTLAATYDPTNTDVPLTDAVIAFPLSAGTHEIELKYTASGLTVGAAISGVCLLALILLLIWKRRSPVLLPDPPQKEAEETFEEEETVTPVWESEGSEPQNESE